MTPEGWLVNLAAIVGAIYAGYQATGSKAEAKRARQLSEPTGNGFARMVIDKLNSIEKNVTDVNAKVDTHIHDHATDAFDRVRREAKLDREQKERDKRD